MGRCRPTSSYLFLAHIAVDLSRIVVHCTACLKTDSARVFVSAYQRRCTLDWRNSLRVRALLILRSFAPPCVITSATAALRMLRRGGKRMSDPISRLEFCRSEIDRVFGVRYAADHPDVVAAVMMSASLDYAALAISRSSAADRCRSC